MPLGFALAIGRAFAWVWYWILPIRLGVARSNIDRVFGNTLDRRERRRILRKSLDHWCMYGVESLRLPKLTAEVVDELIRFEGLEYLVEAAARGKGVIGVTAHVGNFELFAASVALKAFPFSAVTKEVASKSVRDFIVAVRNNTGIELIPPRRSREEIRAALARGRVVAMIADQHMARHRAIVCEMFGQLAATSPAPARFAFETGAALITGHIERLDDQGHHLCRFDPILELETPYDDLQANIRHNTDRLNRRFESWVRAVPEQWLWLHKRFKVHDAPEGWDIPQDVWTRCGFPGSPPPAAPLEKPNQERKRA